MGTRPAAIPRRDALRHLVDLLRVEGTSGREAAVADLVRRKLLAAGCPEEWIRCDRAHRRASRATGADLECGNLIVKLPGTRRGPRRLFSAHLDTVPLCRGARTVRRGDRIVARGDTALGADDRTGVACLVTAVETLLAGEASTPHPPLTFLFSVAEETGLLGSRHVRPVELGRPACGFNVDSGDPARVITGAPGADRWTATVHGIAAHAGVHPEDGVSAAVIAARAIANATDGGWNGRVEKGSGRGTANVGVLAGGETTNQVLDRLRIRGECRSHGGAFLARLTNAWRRAFERAARAERDRGGRTGSVDFEVRRDYEPFRLSPRADVVRAAIDAARRVGIEPRPEVVDGGLDASWLVAHGIPTVTIGAGQHHAHTTREYADVEEYLAGCRLALELAVDH